MEKEGFVENVVAMDQTPMMKQFHEIKSQYPQAIILFRCGDFYETYLDDAILTSKILNLVLTKRSNGKSNQNTEMCGFPYHALDSYLPKLVRAGYRVAICDQLEDPKKAKKLVKRGVTELVTPGVSYSDSTLQNNENNFVACLNVNNKTNVIGIALLDISTGEFLVAQGDEEKINKLLGNFLPKEVLYLRGLKKWFQQYFGADFFTFELEDWMLSEAATKERLIKQFDTASLKGFGIENLPEATIAAGGILHYLDVTQHTKTEHIQHIARLDDSQFVWLDNFTIQNLELLRSNHDKGKCLADVLDKTKCPMGGRLLRRWIAFPLKNLRQLQNRQSVVKFFFENHDDLKEINGIISQIQDIERILSKVSTGRITPQEVLQLANALALIKKIKGYGQTKTNVPFLQTLCRQITPCEKIEQRINQTIQANAPAVQGKKNTIKHGVSKELDELRDLLEHNFDKLNEIKKREISNTGIPTLKIDFNNVFGYFIEVRKGHTHLVPKEWTRKQTLTTAERYTTPELKSYEEKIFSAEDRILEMETQIYNELVAAIAEYISAIQINANVVAQLDCLTTFAQIALENNYCCPQLNDALTIAIQQGRHPMIEQMMKAGEEYIANDVLLDNNDQQICIITGPNMSGKSAFLRQTAIITLMAQMGSFIPAKSATIGLVDKIFTRVGASDNITLGESTFMVEMNEAASILNNISERSLVIFDELGRGTSTYDGISIAWAIVEYLHQLPNRPKTLFATHYHELNDMEQKYERVHNFHVSVKEIGEKVIFLRKLVPGGVEHSFGIHVAKMAGIPQSIVYRANQILQQLENSSDNRQKIEETSGTTTQNNEKNNIQLSFFQLDDPLLEQIRDEIISINIDQLTPLEALNKLNNIKKILAK